MKSLLLLLMLCSHLSAVPPPKSASGLEVMGNGGLTVYYGRKWLKEHTAHLQRNQAKNPRNLKYMKLSKNPNLNRQLAFKGVPPQAFNPVTGRQEVRDEKPPAMVDNFGPGFVTVEYMPAIESSGRGGRGTRRGGVAGVNPRSGYSKQIDSFR